MAVHWRRLSASSLLAFAVSLSALPGRAQSPAQSQAGQPATAAVPVVMVSTAGAQISQTGRVTGTLKVISEHDGSLKDLGTRPAALETRMTIELHGSSSVVLAKKSYDVELVDAEGDERELGLAGLPRGSDWVLHGCGRDKTCLRNALVYAAVRDSGRYAPRTQFIELFLNDEYHGVYIVTERIRRDGDRVDLPRPADTREDGDITGGYLFKIDMGEGTPRDRVPRDWVSSVTPTIYSFVYPRFDRITAAQKAYLIDHVTSFERLMRSSVWNAPAAGYRSRLDVPSWVEFALVQELANNPDAYSKSVYLQKLPEARGNLLALGPVWDFDLAFGVVEFRDARKTDVWAHNANRFPPEGVAFAPPGAVPRVPEYWVRLWSDAAFRRDAKCRWQELRAGPLRLEALTTRIDQWVEQLAPAQQRDGERWNNPEPERYPGEVKALKEWLQKRLTWMDANLPGTCTNP